MVFCITGILKKTVTSADSFPVVFLYYQRCLFFFSVDQYPCTLKLKTFSNLDHHFIRHDGFEVARNIELGRSDTVNYKNNSFNRFVFAKKNGASCC